MKKDQTIPPVRPNEGIRVAYALRLEKLIDRMTKDVERVLLRQYRTKPPELAADASPAAELRAAIARLAQRWQREFDKLSQELAEYFATAATDRSEKALASMLRKRGFTVRFRPTRAQNDALQATIGENVGLIKSIPQRYMTGVDGAVMRSVQAGRDLGSLAKELHEQRGVTKRRAAHIALDQNNKATATITRVRQTELGIVEAVWIHSGAGKHPRPEHVAFNGKTYKVAKGAYLEGKWTWPGVEINCRCTSRSIIPGLPLASPK
jgi:SPP1 gp7 family putative phage head morphogenesis protein